MKASGIYAVAGLKTVPRPTRFSCPFLYVSEGVGIPTKVLVNEILYLLLGNL